MASIEFKTAMESPMRSIKARLTFDETAIDSSYIKSISIDDSNNSSDDTLQIGSAVSNKAEITIRVPTGFNLSFTSVVVEIGVVLSNNTIEYETIGKFYPSSVESEDGYATVKITAYDFMAKLTEKYVPTVELPTTDTAIISDICQQYGITFVGTTLGCSIKEIYSASVQDTLGYMAGLQGMNAHFNNNDELTFEWYIIPVKWGELSTKKWEELSGKTWGEIARKDNE